MTSPALDPYQRWIRPLLFQGLKVDPEWAHQRALGLLGWLSDPPPYGQPWVKGITPWLAEQFTYRSDRLGQTLWGQQFPNPLGLAAGFDKDGVAAAAWPHLGFGFAELGTVTYHAQPGNPKPRLFRLVEDQAVLNRMGFNNQGAAALAQRLAHLRETQGASPIPLGINLGKSKITPLEAAIADYVGSFRQVYPWGAYFVVNVSSPNTPGLRTLQGRSHLAPILAALQQENPDQKPLLVKIAPDLAWEDIADIVDLAQEYGLAGIIATNTTLERSTLRTPRLTTGNPPAAEAGGISGAPLRHRATAVIRFIYRHSQGQLPIIGVGGIFTAEDAWEKITAGASLLQVYTGWVYEGPAMARRLLAGLEAHLVAAGYDQISQAIGRAAT